MNSWPEAVAVAQSSGLTLSLARAEPGEIRLSIWTRSERVFGAKLLEEASQDGLEVGFWRRGWEEHLFDGVFDWRMPVSYGPAKPPARPRRRPALMPLRPRGEIAEGRDRALAARVIERQLREGLAKVVSWEVLRPEWPPLADVKVGSVAVMYSMTSKGCYFRVGAPIQMTGYLDPVPPGRYADGRIDFMTWKRGNEAALVD